MRNGHDAAQVHRLCGTLSHACHFNAVQPTPRAAEAHAWLNDAERSCRLLAQRETFPKPRPVREAAAALPPLPLGVQTGHMVDRCSET